MRQSERTCRRRGWVRLRLQQACKPLRSPSQWLGLRQPSSLQRPFAGTCCYAERPLHPSSLRSLTSVHWPQYLPRSVASSCDQSSSRHNATVFRWQHRRSCTLTDPLKSPIPIQAHTRMPQRLARGNRMRRRRQSTPQNYSAGQASIGRGRSDVLQEVCFHMTQAPICPPVSSQMDAAGAELVLTGVHV